MFKQLRLMDLAFFVVLGAVVALVLLLPVFPEEDLDRLNASSTIALTGALVWVTARYTRETTKMAREAEKQTNALLEQVALDLEPKLVGTIRKATSDPSVATFVLVNLSRHPMWIEDVGATPQQITAALHLNDLKGGIHLQPGESTTMTFHDPVSNNGRILVEFFYGPTGSKLHAKQWLLEESSDGVVAVEETS